MEQGRLIAVRLDDARFGGGPATVVAYPESADAYNTMVTDRDGARDPQMRLWRTRDAIAIGTRVIVGLVCGTGIAALAPEAR